MDFIKNAVEQEAVKSFTGGGNNNAAVNAIEGAVKSQFGGNDNNNNKINNNNNNDDQGGNSQGGNSQGGNSQGGNSQGGITQGGQYDQYISKGVQYAEKSILNSNTNDASVQARDKKIEVSTIDQPDYALISNQEFRLSYQPKSTAS